MHCGALRKYGSGVVDRFDATSTFKKESGKKVIIFYKQAVIFMTDGPTKSRGALVFACCLAWRPAKYVFLGVFACVNIFNRDIPFLHSLSLKLSNN